MAKASTPTLLSLEQYAEILGCDPRHFNGVVCDAFPVENTVTDVVFKYSWQDVSHASHEEIALGIAQAEQRIADFIGFWPAPQYFEDEVTEFPRFNPGGIGAGSFSFNTINTLYRKPTVHCAWKKFIKGGKRRLDLLDDSATIVYSDEDSDGFDETATITVTGVVGTDWLLKEIAVYPTDDTTVTERIRGLRIYFSGSDVIIVGQSVLFVDPILMEYAKESNAIDGDEASNFLSEVYVYREYCSNETNTYASVEFLYQNTDSSTVLPSFSMNYGVLQPYNKERSIVTLFPGTWNTTTLQWDYAAPALIPNLVKMHYQAGINSDAQGRMQPTLARAVAALATALITKPVISQGPPDNLQERWQGYIDSKKTQYSVATCPWGMSVGAYEAFSIVRDMFGEGIGTASL